jgi:hypothetical protein
MGFVLFSIGNALAILGLVLAALGYAQGSAGAWIIALVAVGELTTLGSVFALGNDGDTREPESRSVQRHLLGITLLIAHLGAYLFVWMTAILGYSTATAQDPFPSVFGLTFEAQGPLLVWGVIAAELLFVLAMLALGPAWWRSFKELFRYESASSAPEPGAPKPPPTLRYRIGLGVFIFGNLLAVTGMLLPAFGLASGRMVGFIAVILAAGEIISWSSIVLLGKEGFKELKTRLFAVLKRTPSGEPVSLQRHGAGVSLLALHVAAQFLALVFPIAAHFGTAADGTFPTVLGLSRPEQLNWFVGLLVASEALFFAGVYTLGADWWGRFRALFRS